MLFDLILFLLLIVGIRCVCFVYCIPIMMSMDTRSIERYSHCLCLHVQPTSLIIGFIHLISSLLSIVLHFEDYSQYRDDDRRMDIHRSTATSLNMMVSLMMAIVSALLIYGVTKSRPSYLMPFFGVKLYIFFFSLPASISMLCFSPHLSPQYETNSRTWGSDMKRLWSSSDPTTAYTSSIFMAVIEFLYQLYFICVIWKCYRYLKLKESVIPLHIPYHLRGVEVSIPSEIVTTPSVVAPPDYETATKLNPPPDYDSAIKNYQMVPNQVCNNMMGPPIMESNNSLLRGGDNHHNNQLITTDCHDNQLSRSGSDYRGSLGDNKGTEKCSDDKNSFSETTSSQQPPSTCHDSDSSHHFMDNSNDGCNGFGGTFNDNSSSTCDNTGATVTTNTNTTESS